MTVQVSWSRPGLDGSMPGLPGLCGSAPPVSRLPHGTSGLAWVCSSHWPWQKCKSTSGNTPGLLDKANGMAKPKVGGQEMGAHKVGRAPQSHHGDHQQSRRVQDQGPKYQTYPPKTFDVA